MRANRRSFGDFWQSKRNRILLMLGALLVVGIVILFQPWTANHFGYALPGSGKLPNSIAYGPRHYDNIWMCAGADWCQHNPAPGYCPSAGIYDGDCPRPASLCATQAQLQTWQALPLHQAGWVWTAFGVPHKLLVGPTGGLQMGIYVEDTPGCYLEYGLMGGP